MITLSDIIRDNKELLNQRKFDDLYKIIPKDLKATFTDTMYSLNIDPIRYFKDTIPSHFLYECGPSGENVPTQMVLPNHIKTIAHHAFKSCYILRSITLSQVEDVEQEAFSDCSLLREVVFSEGLYKIHMEAFRDCESLTRVDLPYSVEIIEQDAFENCINLQNVILPEKLYVIDFYAFSNCTSLKNVEITSRLTCLNNGAFKNCITLEKLTICKSFKEAGENIFEGINKEFIIEFYCATRC